MMSACVYININNDITPLSFIILSSEANFDKLCSELIR